ncbi:Na+/H+ antiporter NhaP like protein [Nitzschia inconspicua]|uniref:Na+/H+ antiporter NhaP like protein n=1 Tax=Nitzschia inconspicua TaxID=303405 RepID=A0A9K3M5C5_9STRA|nr:Na+/H+ antiporter NhaP like protein [Nitzschia inconspicua]
MVIGVGMCAGYLIHLVVGPRLIANAAQQDLYDDDAVEKEEVDIDLASLLSFSPEIFFIFLLPPIIFNTGLRMGALFFRHIAPIVMFAVLGTAISAISTALILWVVVKLGLSGGFQPSLAELLTFGALISSTDPVSTLAVFQAKRVDPRLFYLCFGESVLNDALAIVLFYSFGKFVSKEHDPGDVAIAFGEFFVDLFLNSVGSLVLGCFGGACTGFLFKQIDMRQNRLSEISVLILTMYIPFLIAEILHLSGIVTILFTGITANRYVIPNLSAITKVNADMVFRLGAHLSETAIFLELGLSVFGMVGYWNWAFIGFSVLACLAARALNVYPLSFFYNLSLLRGETVPTASATLWDRRQSPPTSTTNLDLIEGLATPTARNASSNPGVMFEDNTGVGISVLDSTDGPFENHHHQTLDRRTMSFSDQSVNTVDTATPWERKDLKIRWNTVNMLWFSGLRGAVAYACVRTFPNTLGHQKDFAMTTMAVVLITVFLLGSTTELALSWFNIDVGVDEKKYMQSYVREPIVSNAITNFERRYIKPCVIRDFVIMESIRKDVQRHEEVRAQQSRRRCYHPPVEPTIEITESGYLDCVDEEETVEKLVRTDSLFDYGAY